MSAAANARPARSWTPAAIGIASTLAAIVAIELLIRAKLINPFIVPLPSQILAAIPRIVSEENVLHRFSQTAQEVAWRACCSSSSAWAWARSSIACGCCARPAKRGSPRSRRRRSC
jgi:ABC-type nitrate/sulfonate/bicarbonate transport system permease component